MDSPRPRGPSLEEQRAQMKEYWTTYQTWRNDINRRADKSIATLKAQMAAGGVKPGTDIWNQRLEGVEKSRQSQLEEVQGGATYQLLSDWAKAMQRPDTQKLERQAGYRGSPAVGPESAAYVDAETRRSMQQGFAQAEAQGKTDKWWEGAPNYALGREGESDRRTARQQYEARTELMNLPNRETLSTDEYLTQAFGTTEAVSASGSPTADRDPRRTLGGGEAVGRTPWL